MKSPLLESPVVIVMLLIDFPTSVNPTKSKAPTPELVPAPGMRMVWLVPSENVIISVKKLV